MEIKNFRPFAKGSLIGYLDIFLPELNWTLHGCGYFNTNGRRWVGLPSRPYKDQEGKQCYSDVISMPKELKAKFSEEALKAFDKYKQEDKTEKEFVMF